MAMDTSGDTTRVDKTERRILLGAALCVAASLALIGYATWGLGINVPACVPTSKLFDQPSVVKHEGKNYEIHYVARMWDFQPPLVRVPTGSTLDLYAVTKDVTHGLLIAGTNVNLMLVPGAVANTRVHFSRPGTYTILCHEYCGVAHQNMAARIEVTDEVSDIFAAGLAAPGSPGKKVLDDKGCLACHSVDGSAGLAPTLKGIWGTTVELSDGTKRTVDAEFVGQLLHDPSKYVIKGYPPVMPDLRLSDQEIQQIEDYLKGLK